MKETSWSWPRRLGCDYSGFGTNAVYFRGAQSEQMVLLRKFAVIFAAVYVAISGGLLVVMRRPVVFSKVMRHVPDPMMMVVPFKPLWYAARWGTLKVGDAAPAFNLPTADRQSSVSLASFRRQKPVVLIFGSYT